MEQVGTGFELPAEKLEVAPTCSQSELLLLQYKKLKLKKKLGSPG